MRAQLFLVAVVGIVVLASAGCVTEQQQVVSVPGPPGAEECPGTFELCVDLCDPRGVRAFGCWSETQNVDFDCECLDGLRPLEKSLRTEAGEGKNPSPLKAPKTPDRTLGG